MRRRVIPIVELVALPILIVIAWWFGSADSTSVYFPPLRTILQALGEWIPAGWSHDVLPSIINLVVGYLVSVVVAIALGTMIGRIAWLRAASAPLIEFARSIPPAAILPFFILALGPTSQMRMLVIAVGSVWPTLLSTIDGVRGIEPEVLDVTRVYQTSRVRKLFKVILPAASPLILAGMRTSLAFAVILVVVSEMMASTAGIGYFIISSQQYFNLPSLWAGTIVMGLVGYLLSELFTVIERRVLAWKGEI